MSLRRRFERFEAALSILGAVSYVAATLRTFDPAVTVGLVGLPMLLGAWWLALGRGLVLPRWGVNTGLAVVVLYALFRLMAGRINVEIVAELVVFLTCIKIADRRSPRDDAQILLMSVFLAIAALLTSTELLIGVLLVPFVPLLVATVMLFHLYSGWHHAGAPADPAPPRARIGLSVFSSTLAAFTLTLFVFVIVPRGVGGDFLGEFRGPQGRAQTMFTDHVKLGSRDVISESPRIVLELTVSQSGSRDSTAEENLGAAGSVFYLRGAVLEEDPRSPGTWVASRASPQESTVATGVLDLGGPVFARAMIRQDVEVRNLAGRSGQLFSLWKPISMRPSGNRARYKIDPTLGTVSREGDPGVFRYSVWSATPVGAEAPIERRPVPWTGSERLRALAAQALRDAGIEPDPAVRPPADDARAARAIQDYLRRNYAYSLEELAAPIGVVPVEHFLFTSRQGHCEYFAAAMVAMCRSAGINARMIAGYVAAEFTPSTGKYTVRGSNAHAWVEAEAGEDRWVSFDPTPPDDFARAHQPPAGLFARLRQAMESVEYAWNAGVVGFDESSRQRIFSPEDGNRTGVLGWIDGLGRRLRFTGPRTFWRAALAGIAAFVAAAVIGFGVRWAILAITGRRGRSLGIPAQAGLSPERRAQVAFYVRALEALRARGLAKPEWQPPLAHASQLGTSAVAAAAARIAALYYKATFGDRPLSESEMEEASRLVALLGASEG